MDWNRILEAGGVPFFTVVFPAAMALATWYLLRRATQATRAIAAFVAFLFPFLAIFALILYFKFGGRIAGLAWARKQQAATPKAVPEPMPPDTAVVRQPTVVGKSVLDPARLMSSDLQVRFAAGGDGNRKLNIPKVVE